MWTASLPRWISNNTFSPWMEPWGLCPTPWQEGAVQILFEQEAGQPEPWGGRGQGRQTSLPLPPGDPGGWACPKPWYHPGCSGPWA